MSSFRLPLALLLCLSIVIVSCSGGEKNANREPGSEPSTVADTTTKAAAAVAPVARKQYVYDAHSHTIYGIDLEEDKIESRFLVQGDLKSIAYDVARELIYKGYGGKNSGLEVFDPEGTKVVATYQFPQPVSDMLFHPIKRYLYIVSEDSTNFIAFNCDSMTVEQNFPLHVIDKGFVGPIHIQPGPAGKVITANGDRASLTQVFTDKNYLQQTVTLNLAKRIDYAVFSRDGNASYSCDTKSGALFKVQFGTGEMLAQKEGLDRPRLVQLEVNSNTVVLVVGKTKILMLHPDTFTEMGSVDLSEHGDDILSLEIPPKANFAEVLMDYKGVTRWMRFDINNWERTRLVELI